MAAMPKTVILMYHRIASPEVDPWGMSVSVENFVDHLHVIQSVATPLSLSDFTKRRVRGSLPERSVLVTLDDGYVDNYDRALPVLLDQQVPAVIYVATGKIDTPYEFWWDELETLLLTPGTLPEELKISLPQGLRTWALGPATNYTLAGRRRDRDVRAWAALADSRLGLYHSVWQELWPLSETQRDDALRTLRSWAGVSPSVDGARRTMTSEEIGAVARSGLVSVGAHTVDHPPLTRRPLDEQRSQIVNSRRRLEEIVDGGVRSFSYPHGEQTVDTVNLAVQAGFDTAVTVLFATATSDSDPMLLPRYAATDLGAENFEEILMSWFRE